MKKIFIIILLFFFVSCSFFYKEKYTIIEIFEPIEIKTNEYLLILVEQDIHDPYGPNTLFGCADGYEKISNSNMTIYHYNVQSHKKILLKKVSLNKINGVNSNVVDIMPIINNDSYSILLNFYYCSLNYQPTETFLKLEYLKKAKNKNVLNPTEKVITKNDYLQMGNYIEFIKSNICYLIDNQTQLKKIIITHTYYYIEKLSKRIATSYSEYSYETIDLTDKSNYNKYFGRQRGQVLQNIGVKS